MSDFLSNLPQYLALAKEGKELWDKQEGSDKERLDSLVRRAVQLVPLPAQLDGVKGYLATGKDPLPVRLAGVFFHPGVRNLIAGQKAVMVDELATGLKMCSCGEMIPVDVSNDQIVGKPSRCPGCGTEI